MGDSNHIRTCQRLLKVTADGICGPQMVGAMNALVMKCADLERCIDSLLKRNAQLTESLRDKQDILDGLAEGPQNPS
jgi:lysozyme family protein